MKVETKINKILEMLESFDYSDYFDPRLDPEPTRETLELDKDDEEYIDCLYKDIQNAYNKSKEEYERNYVKHGRSE